MPATLNSPVNLGLPQLPLTDDKKLYRDLVPIYNAINILQQLFAAMSVNSGGELIVSAIKSVQRHTFVAAGAFTITAVDTTKTVILSVSKGSAGTVKTDSTVAATTGTVAATTYAGVLAISAPGGAGTLQNGGTTLENGNIAATTTTIAAAALSGGTTDLFTKQYSAVLTDATTITADGPCEVQVVEYM